MLLLRERFKLLNSQIKLTLLRGLSPTYPDDILRQGGERMNLEQIVNMAEDIETAIHQNSTKARKATAADVHVASDSDPTAKKHKSTKKDDKKRVKLEDAATASALKALEAKIAAIKVGGNKEKEEENKKATKLDPKNAYSHLERDDGDIWNNGGCQHKSRKHPPPPIPNPPKSNYYAPEILKIQQSILTHSFNDNHGQCGTSDLWGNFIQLIIYPADRHILEVDIENRN